jgi:hypothetical protein
MVAGIEETHPAIFFWKNSDQRLLVKGLSHQ